MSTKSSTIELVQKLYDRSEHSTTSLKKDVNHVIQEQTAGIEILREVIECWAANLTLLGTLEIPLDIDIHDGDSLKQVEQVLNSIKGLLDCFDVAKTNILHPKLEDIQDEIVSDLRSLINDLTFVLGFYDPAKSTIANKEMYIESVLKNRFSSSKSKLAKHKRQLQQFKVYEPSSRAPFSRKTFNPFAQRGCLLTIIAILSIYIFHFWLPPEMNETFKLFSKIFIWLFTLIWFQTYFLHPFASSQNNIATSIIYIQIWVLGASIWTYGIGIGFLVAILLQIPFFLIFRADKKTVEKRPQEVLYASVYRWGWLSMVIVGIFITKEQVWLIGAVIWFMFTIIAQISFRFFRTTFDMLAATDPEQEDTAQVRRRMIYYSYIATVIAFIPGLIGSPPAEFISLMYQYVGAISFGLIAILIGVQAIIPSIGSWGNTTASGEVTPIAIREMKVYIIHHNGLTGFMRIFFIVTLISTIGIAILGRTPGDSFNIDLSGHALLTPTPNILSLLNPTTSFHFSEELTYTHLHNLFFVIFLSSFFYSMSALYYLFMATSILILPIKDALASVPIIIQKTQYIDLTAGKSKLCEQVEKRLKNTTNLNGNVISQLNLTINADGTTFCNIHLTEDFPTLKGLQDNTVNVLAAVFSEHEIDEVAVTIFRPPAGKLGQMKLFGIQVNRQEYKFIVQKSEVMDYAYKLRQLGAKPAHYLLPEAQLL